MPTPPKLLQALSLKPRWDIYGKQQVTGEPESTDVGRKYAPFFGYSDKPGRLARLMYSLSAPEGTSRFLILGSKPMDYQKMAPDHTEGASAMAKGASAVPKLSKEVFVNELAKEAQMAFPDRPPMAGSNVDKAQIMRSLLLTMLIGEHKGTAVPEMTQVRRPPREETLGGFLSDLYHGRSGPSPEVQQQLSSLYGAPSDDFYHRAQQSAAGNLVADARLRNVMQSLRQQQMGLALQG